MVLGTCLECDGDLSSKAPVCPHCGHTQGTVMCRECGQKNGPQEKACKWCGQALLDTEGRPARRRRRGPPPEGAITVLIYGILGIMLCFLFSIAAWTQGNTYMAECKKRGVEPEGLAVAGRILGIIATVLLIVGVVLGVLVIFGAVILGLQPVRG